MTLTTKQIDSSPSHSGGLFFLLNLTGNQRASIVLCPQTDTIGLSLLGCMPTPNPAMWFSQLAPKGCPQYRLPFQFWKG